MKGRSKTGVFGGADTCSSASATYNKWSMTWALPALDCELPACQTWTARVKGHPNRDDRQ